MSANPMTKEALKKHCKDKKLYNTPGLNDKLYLHYHGWNKIENLEEYTGLKVLWLEGNGFSSVGDGLKEQTELKTLYLQENLLSNIEGLDTLTELDSLNVSKNHILKIENVSKLQKLTTLQMGNNHLQSAADLEAILELPLLSCLDIQSNKIDDVEILEILEKIPDLRVLYLKGNPVVKDIPHYRKTLVGRCNELRYLDDRPVFEEERGRCNAWYKAFKEGGDKAAQQAELEEIKRQREAKKAKEDANHKAFQDMMDKGKLIRKQREEAEKMVEANGALDFNIFSGLPILGDGSLPTPNVHESDDDDDDHDSDGEGAAVKPPNPHKKTTLPTNIFGGDFTPEDGDDEDGAPPPLETAVEPPPAPPQSNAVSSKELAALKLEEMKAQAGTAQLPGLLAGASAEVAKDVVVLKKEEVPAPVVAAAAVAADDDMDDMD